MKTYDSITEHLKAGLTKAEIYEKLNTVEGKGKSLAEAISSFPCCKNYLGKQKEIQRFYYLLMTYFVLLFGLIVIGLGFQKNWPALAVVMVLVGFCIFMFSFAKKCVLNAMLLMLAFPFVKTLQLAYEHISILITTRETPFSSAEVLMMNLSSLFFLISLFTLIYGVKLFLDIFEGEKLVRRHKWDHESLKPSFHEEKALPTQMNEQPGNQI